MPDVVRSSRVREVRANAATQNSTRPSSRLDELRRQLSEVLARQQWLEDLYRQGEGKLAQFQEPAGPPRPECHANPERPPGGRGRMNSREIADLAPR